MLPQSPAIKLFARAQDSFRDGVCYRLLVREQVEYRGYSKLKTRTAPGWSYAPGHRPTKGPYGGVFPYSRVTPVQGLLEIQDTPRLVFPRAVGLRD